MKDFFVAVFIILAILQGVLLLCHIVVGNKFKRKVECIVWMIVCLGMSLVVQL